MGAEDWVLRGGNLRTPPGPGGSNGKEAFLGAAGAPGLQSLSGIVFALWAKREGATIVCSRPFYLIGVVT